MVHLERQDFNIFSFYFTMKNTNCLLLYAKEFQILAHVSFSLKNAQMKKNTIPILKFFIDIKQMICLMENFSRNKTYNTTYQSFLKPLFCLTEPVVYVYSHFASPRQSPYNRQTETIHCVSQSAGGLLHIENFKIISYYPPDKRVPTMCPLLRFLSQIQCLSYFRKQLVLSYQHVLFCDKRFHLAGI